MTRSWSYCVCTTNPVYIYARDEFIDIGGIEVEAEINNDMNISNGPL